MNQHGTVPHDKNNGEGRNSSSHPLPPPPLPPPSPPIDDNSQEETPSKEKSPRQYASRKGGALRAQCNLSNRHLSSVIEEENGGAEEMLHDAAEPQLVHDFRGLEIVQESTGKSAWNHGNAHHFRIMSDLTNQEGDFGSGTSVQFDTLDVPRIDMNLQKQEVKTMERNISWSSDVPHKSHGLGSSKEEGTISKEERISLHDLTLTMDQKVEAAIVETFEKEQSMMRRLSSDQDAAKETGTMLTGITDQAAQHFLKHQPSTTSHSLHRSASERIQRKLTKGTEADLTNPDHTGAESKDEEMGIPIRARRSQKPLKHVDPIEHEYRADDLKYSSRDKKDKYRTPKHVSRPSFANLVLDMQQVQYGESRALRQYGSLRHMNSKGANADSDNKEDNTFDDVIPDSVESSNQKESSKQSREALRKNTEARGERWSAPSSSRISDTDLFYQNAAKVFKHSRDASVRASAEDLNEEHDPFLKAESDMQESPRRVSSQKARLPGTPVTDASDANLDRPSHCESEVEGSLGANRGSTNAWNVRNAKGETTKDSTKCCAFWVTCLVYLRFRIQQIFHPHDISAAFSYSKLFIGLVLVPLLGVAAILYYVFDSPLTVRAGGSVSWWFILAARWALTFTLAKIAQYALLDCICLRSSFALNVFGPLATLTFVQSKGWPFQLTFWGGFNFALLYGNTPFTHHWLYYQPWINMFNANNQAATVLSNGVYRSVLIVFLVTGVFASLKRTAVSLYLGRRTCEFYGPQLRKIIQDIILISSVAQLAKGIERESFKEGKVGIDKVGHLSNAASPFYVLEKSIFQPKLARDRSQESEEDQLDEERSQGDEVCADQSEQDSMTKSPGSEPYSGVSYCSRRHASNTRKLLKSRRGNLLKDLDQWEEPVNILESERHEDVSLQEILHFRNAMNQLRNSLYPFSEAFGPANDRKACIDSAQEVYSRLMMHTPHEDSLPFETISIIGLDQQGNLDEVKTKMLLRTFRPNGNGKLRLLDFVKCCDDVYKRYRTFRAAVANSSVVNNAYERIINGVFYFLLTIAALLILRVDVWTLLVSLSTFVVSFAFAFGNAVSKFTEGAILVVVRKPFDIGDRVHVSDPNMDTPPDGTAAWFVENITLFATTFRFATTNEVCTIANGNLANSRIINAARSPNMLCYVHMKFGIEVPYEKVMFFKKIAENFVKERPREWAGLVGFRATRVQADQGFIEYVLVLQHRLSWQDIVPMLNAKAEFSSFCLEVTKKLNMRYVAPPLPVELGFEEGVTPPTTWAKSEPKEGEQNHPLDAAVSHHSPGHTQSRTLDESSAAMKAIQEMFSPPKSRKK